MFIKRRLIYEYIHIWICVFENDSQLCCVLSCDMAEQGKWVMKIKSLNGEGCGGFGGMWWVLARPCAGGGGRD